MMTLEQRKARDLATYRRLFVAAQSRPGITKRQWRALHEAARVVAVWMLVDSAIAQQKDAQTGPR